MSPDPEKIKTLSEHHGADFFPLLNHCAPSGERFAVAHPKVREGDGRPTVNVNSEYDLPHENFRCALLRSSPASGYSSF